MDDHDDPDDLAPRRRRLGRGKAEAEVKRRPKNQLHALSTGRRGETQERYGDSRGFESATCSEDLKENSYVYQALEETRGDATLFPLPAPAPEQHSREPNNPDGQQPSTSTSRATDNEGEPPNNPDGQQPSSSTSRATDNEGSPGEVAVYAGSWPKELVAALEAEKVEDSAAAVSSNSDDVAQEKNTTSLPQADASQVPEEERFSKDLAVDLPVNTIPDPQSLELSEVPTSPVGRGLVADVKAPKAKEAGKTSRSRCSCGMCVDFPFCTAHCPFLVACLALLATPVLMILLWPGIVINNDTSVFLEADSRSSAIRSAYLGALPFRDPSVESPNGRRLMTGLMPPIDVEDMYKMDKLVLYYSTSDPKGLLQEKFLRPMRALELDIRDGPLYQRTCHELSTPGLGVVCDPGHSVVNAAFPSEVVNASETDSYYQKPMDGRGQEMLEPDVIRRVISKKKDYKELMLPAKYQEDDVIMTARSFFAWNMWCCRIDVPASERSTSLDKLRGEWLRLMTSEVMPKLVAFQQESLRLKRDLRLNFDGDEISTLQLWDVLQSDCLFAIGSVTFIITYLTIHAGSPLLSCGSMLLTMLAIPMAFLITAWLSGSNEVTGAAFLSIFLITGLGADVVLVFINFWERSTDADPTDVDTERDGEGGSDGAKVTRSSFERVKYVYRHAGLACLGTTLTTAASFFANLASVLRALREFGFFMGMCILGAYVYLLLILPALLICNDRLAALRCTQRCSGLVRGTKRTLGQMVPRQLHGGSTGGTRVCERLVLSYRRCCFLFFLLLVITFGFWTANVALLDVGVPQMFPDGHNLNDVEDISEEFQEATERWTQNDLRICNFLPAEDRLSFLKCAVHECQISLEGPLKIVGSTGDGRNGSAECECFASEIPSSVCYTKKEGDQGFVSVRVRIVGNVPHEALELWRQSQEYKDFMLEAAVQANPVLRTEIEAGMDESYFRWSQEGPGHGLQQEFWETGESFSTYYEVLPNFAIPIKRTDATRLCFTDQMCYCGAAICTYPGRRLVDPVVPDVFYVHHLEIPLPRRVQSLDEKMSELTPSREYSLLPPLGRRLQGSVDVSLVWGLKANDAMPLLGKAAVAWHFQAAFRMDAPSTQRSMLAACSLGDDNPDLLVQDTFCWIKEFRNYVLRNGMPFPVQSTWFQSTFAQFVDGRVLPSGILAKDYMWLTESFELKATYIQFMVGLNYMTAQSSTILSLMKEWDKVVDEINRDAPPELGSTWHTSSLWIRAEAELAIVNSTLLTMLVSAMCGFLGALFFTHWDPFLSLMVVVNVIGVTLSLAWFMMVLMAWAVGVLEVLGLIVFVGYSITYTLHVAHKYQEHTRSSESMKLGRQFAERRKRAVTYALRSMSGSIVGSAITTLGSSFFLFFCQLVIFVKLATVLFSVTFFACVFATVAFPAALLCVGPVNTSCDGLSAQTAASCGGPSSSESGGPRHAEAQRVQVSNRLASKILVDDGSTSQIFMSSSLPSKTLARTFLPSVEETSERRPKMKAEIAITVL